jgi:hypothetical protein
MASPDGLAPRRNRRCLFACYHTSDDSKDKYTMFDPETSRVFCNTDVMCLGKVDFKRRAVPRADIEVLVPTVRAFGDDLLGGVEFPLKEEEEKEEEKEEPKEKEEKNVGEDEPKFGLEQLSRCRDYEGDGELCVNTECESEHDNEGFLGDDGLGWGYHLDNESENWEYGREEEEEQFQLGRNWDYEAPEEEILFDFELGSCSMGLLQEDQVARNSKEEILFRQPGAFSYSRYTPDDSSTIVSYLTGSVISGYPSKCSALRHKIIGSGSSISISGASAKGTAAPASIRTVGDKSMSNSNSMRTTTTNSNAVNGQAASPSGGWMLRGDITRTYLRKGYSELRLETPINMDRKVSVEDATSAFSLDTPDPKDMVFLYNILNNLGLPVKLSGPPNPEDGENSWSVGGRTKHVNVRKNVNILRKLRGNKFQGRDWQNVSPDRDSSESTAVRSFFGGATKTATRATTRWY